MQKKIQFVLALIICIAANNVACSQQPGKPNNSNAKNEQTDMETETNKQVIRNLYENILNKKRLDLLNTAIDDNYIGVRDEKGAEGFKQIITPLIASFPDIQWKIEELLSEGSKVVVRWKWTGTFKNAFMGYQPNQKQFTNEAIVIYEMSNKKAIRAWMQSDRLGFWLQAGVISADMLPGGAPRKTN